MARRKKAPTPAMVDGEQKIAGMKAIKRDLDLGSGVSVAEIEEILDDERVMLEEHNSLLAQLDTSSNKLKAQDKLLLNALKKVLPAVGLKYGTDSNEYEMVGGVRDSERKKPGKKPKTPPVE